MFAGLAPLKVLSLTRTTISFSFALMASALALAKSSAVASTYPRRLRERKPELGPQVRERAAHVAGQVEQRVRIDEGRDDRCRTQNGYEENLRLGPGVGLR